jgi:hypothetical protein
VRALFVFDYLPLVVGRKTHANNQTPTRTLRTAQSGQTVSLLKMLDLSGVNLETRKW